MESDPLFGPGSDPTYEGPQRPSGVGRVPTGPGSLPRESDEPEGLGELQSASDISQRHREIIRLAFLGRTSTEIAERMSMDPGSVRLILRTPMAQAELARLNNKAEAILVNTPLRVALDKDLRDAATESLRLNRSVINDPSVDMRVRTKTAAHFMDRIIFSEGPNEQESSYRDILRRLDAIDRNVRINGTGVTLFPPGSLKDVLNHEEVKHVNEPRESDGPAPSPRPGGDVQQGSG